MKSIITAIFVCLITIIALSNTVKADEGLSISLPSGQSISLEGLNNTERASMLKYVEKINNNTNKTKNIIGSLPTDVEELDKWRKLITNTIKDVCTDLNITVNDFVKTPVGMGVSGLIVYKIAGKDLLSKIISITLIIPVWISITLLILVVSWYMLSSKKIHYGKTETENDKGKKVITYKDTVMEKRYDWNSDEARCSFGIVMIAAELALTIVSLTIIFR